MQTINLITKLDYPDPDVIRVDDTYYMVSTTMYFMPGCEILRSYDLCNWEHAAFVYDFLDSTPAQRLEGTENIYGQGMWAASLRYHEGFFYIVFVANDTHKTYLYKSPKIDGPWEKSEIEGFYHDNSVLFDDDGRVYIVYGNKEIHLTELESDLSGPKKGGLDRVIIVDSDDVYLGYEGAHFYKINGKYYIFLIHMPKSTARRTEAVFMANSLTDEFKGQDICDDDMGFFNSGVAQGGIVETPKGRWYSILFQDTGAVGRIPVLIPMKWVDDMPVIDSEDEKTIPDIFEIEDNNPGYEYMPLYGSDDFKDCPDEKPESRQSYGFKSFWQFNHEPDLSLVNRDGVRGKVRITTDKLCQNVVQAKNTLTQRTMLPGCRAEVSVDGNELKEGDYAGLCILESAYAFVAITRRDGELWLVMKKRTIETDSIWGERKDTEPGEELESVKLPLNCDGKVRLVADIDYTNRKDMAKLYYYDEAGSMKSIGNEVQLAFRLDHFTGARFGLFVYSTIHKGGSAEFSDFKYRG